MPLIVLLDARVLYPAPLRDLLMRLALLDAFHAKGTDDIHAARRDGVYLHLSRRFGRLGGEGQCRQ